MKTFIKNILFISVCIIIGCVNIKNGGNNKNTLAQTSTSSAPPENQTWQDTIADITGKIFLGTEQGAVFYAFDTLAHPHEPINLTCRLRHVKLLHDIPDATIAYYLNSHLIDIAQTDQNGFAAISWTPPAAQDYLFTLKIAEIPENQDQKILKIDPVPLLVAARDISAPFVVIDLDHTVVDSSFFRVLLGGGKPMTDSVNITKKIAQKYSLIYLTHRPDLMTLTSKSWLRNHGFPPAPLLVSELKQALGSSGDFKSAKIAELQKSFPNLKIGIGDKLSDAQAYVDNGMTAYLIPHYRQKPGDMLEMALHIRNLQDRGRLQVVSGWRQIDAGIFHGKKYPPAAFADWLEKQARLLENMNDD